MNRIILLFIRAESKKLSKILNFFINIKLKIINSIRIEFYKLTIKE